MMKSKYQSGEYFREVYLPNKMSFKDASLWMGNYYKVVCSLLPKLDDMKVRKLLELGCGYGGFVDQLNKRGFRDVTASDISDLIYNHDLKNKYVKLDLGTTISISEKFNMVFAFEVLEHLSDLGLAVTNIKRLLAKDGLFIFSTPYPHKKHLFDRYHINIQYPNFYTNLFNRYDFRLITMKEISFIPLVWRFGYPVHMNGLIESKYFLSEVFFVFKNATEM